MLITPPAPTTCPLAAALAGWTQQAQQLADSYCPGLGIALSVDTTERGPLYMLFTYDLETGRASYLCRTSVGAGYSAGEALAQLQDSLAMRYGMPLAEAAADAALSYAKEGEAGL